MATELELWEDDDAWGLCVLVADAWPWPWPWPWPEVLPWGKIDSNSLIKGNEFMRFVLPDAALVFAVAEMVLSGDTVVQFKGEVFEMNWLKPDKSSEWVLWWLFFAFIWPSGGVTGSIKDWTEFTDSWGWCWKCIMKQ